MSLFLKNFSGIFFSKDLEAKVVMDNSSLNLPWLKNNVFIDGSGTLRNGKFFSDKNLRIKIGDNELYGNFKINDISNIFLSFNLSGKNFDLTGINLNRKGSGGANRINRTKSGSKLTSKNAFGMGNININRLEVRKNLRLRDVSVKLILFKDRIIFRNIKCSLCEGNFSCSGFYSFNGDFFAKGKVDNFNLSMFQEDILNKKPTLTGTLYGDYSLTTDVNNFLNSLYGKGSVKIENGTFRTFSINQLFSKLVKIPFGSEKKFSEKFKDMGGRFFVKNENISISDGYIHTSIYNIRFSGYSLFNGDLDIKGYVSPSFVDRSKILSGFVGNRTRVHFKVVGNIKNPKIVKTRGYEKKNRHNFLPDFMNKFKFQP